MPKGSLGSCMMNRLNFVFGGNPLMLTVITSAGPRERILTPPLAPSRHPSGAATGRTILKLDPLACAAAVPAMTIARANIAPRTSNARLCPRLIWSPLFSRRSGGAPVLPRPSSLPGAPPLRSLGRSEVATQEQQDLVGHRLGVVRERLAPALL